MTTATDLFLEGYILTWSAELSKLTSKQQTQQMVRDNRRPYNALLKNGVYITKLKRGHQNKQVYISFCIISCGQQFFYALLNGTPILNIPTETEKLLFFTLIYCTKV